MTSSGSSRGGGPRRSARDQRGFRGAGSTGGGRGPAPGRPARGAPRSATPSRRDSRPAASIDRLMATQRWGTLEPLLERAGADVPAVMEHLRRFTRDLLEWNRRASNLVSGADEARVVERHLAESLAPAAWMRDAGHARWMDLGSGGGFPAIPLVLCGVGERWTLVESRRTKTLFLRKACQDLGLGLVDVVNDRVENLVASPELADTFDAFSSRATMKLGPTLSAAAHFVRTGGEAFLWKGSGREQEMLADPSWRERWRLVDVFEIAETPTVVCRFSKEK